MRLLIPGVLLLMLSIAVAGSHYDAATQAQGPTHDVTAKVERLGGPFRTGAFARNVWDMHAFGGRIYLGHGNSANDGPDPNAGPIPVWYVDAATGALVNHATVDEEQVEVFRVLDGRLTIPGRDPRGPAGAGNMYRLDGEQWTALRTIPDVLHTFDLALYEGALFAANGTTEPNSILRSSDGGRSWRVVFAEPGRVYSLFTFQGKLYAARLISAGAATDGILVFDGARFSSAGLAGSLLVPGAPEHTSVQLQRIEPFRGQLVYIAARPGAGFDPWMPFGLYAAPALDQARRVALPEASAVPYDLITRGQTVYVLAAERKAGGGHTNLVYASDDLVTWSEVLRFDAATFARSFEEAGGAFYFGLGSEADAVSAATGDILRVRSAPVPVSPAPTRTPSGTPLAPRQYAPLIRTHP